MNDFDNFIKIGQYITILRDHGLLDSSGRGAEKLGSDLTRIMETLPLIIEACEAFDPNDTDLSMDAINNRFNTIYDNFKYMANMCKFVDTMLPLANKYNPSEEDKERFLEFIGYKQRFNPSKESNNEDKTED